MSGFLINRGRVTTIDLGGFNELRFCREGPMLYNRNDVYVGGSIRMYGEYNLDEAEFLYSLIDKESVVIEVGANIGSHTVGLAKRAAKVYAFEPQRHAFQVLCANVALNSLENVSAHQCAVGNHMGHIEVPVMDPNTLNNFGAVSLNAGDVEMKREVVEILPLDQYDFDGIPSLIKIDVEGMEADVIYGAQARIKEQRPILYVENDRQEKSAALIDLIRGLGYALWWHTPRLFSPRNFADNQNNVFKNIVSINMLCVPAEKRYETHFKPV